MRVEGDYSRVMVDSKPDGSTSPWIMDGWLFVWNDCAWQHIDLIKIENVSQFYENFLTV
jgi:hypothetical protein